MARLSPEWEALARFLDWCVPQARRLAEQAIQAGYGFADVGGIVFGASAGDLRLVLKPVPSRGLGSRVIYA